MLPTRFGLKELAACILLLAFGISANANLSCLDEQGEPVDWFIAYKFPKLDGDKSFVAGTAYSYITSKDVEEEPTNRRAEDPDSRIFIYKFKDFLLKYLGYRAPKSSFRKTQKRYASASTEAKWIASNHAISDAESILMQTLAPAFNPKNSNLNSVFYNDDPSDTTEDHDSEGDDESPKKKKDKGNARRAHAKGVLLMDDHSMEGLWLTHSVPRFPKVRGLDLHYPPSGVKFGQTFMCISIKVDEAGKQLVDHLVNMRVLVYDNKISEKLYSMIPQLHNLDVEEKMKLRRIPVQPQLAQMITTRDGKVVHLFSKSMSLGADLYSGWIDDALGTDLYVETWRNGQGNPLDSFCPKGNHHVNNVKDLKYDKQRQWPYSKDHSKWAISEVRDAGIVCIGDSNRMESQFKRGGGAVCIKCPTCWDIFSNTIQDVEPCPKGTKSGAKSEPKDARETLEKIRQAMNL